MLERILLFLCFTFSLRAQSAWINELHYDNVGVDQGEGFEILVDTSQLNWRELHVRAYNGSDSLYYGSEVDLLDYDSVGTSGNYRFFWLNHPNLQNGPRDALALYKRSNGQEEMLHFLSYEGQIVAKNGPALNDTSADIGLSQSNSTPIGKSIQLEGNGFRLTDFYYNHANRSPAQVNHSQNLQSLLQRSSRSSYIRPLNLSRATVNYLEHLDTSQAQVILSKFYLVDGVDSDSLATVCTGFDLLLEGAETLSAISLWRAGQCIWSSSRPRSRQHLSNLAINTVDNDSVLFSLRAYFIQKQFDNSRIHCEIENIQTAANSSHLQKTSYLLTDSSDYAIEVKADRFRILALPDTLINPSRIAKLSIEACDSLQNRDQDFQDSVTFIPGFNQDTIRLGFQNGQAIIQNLQVDQTPADYLLSLISDSLNYKDSVYVRSLNHASLLIINGVFDGPLAWGRPKGVELYSLGDIPSLAYYAIGIANNGQGSDGPELILPDKGISAGSTFYVASDSASFKRFFGHRADTSSGLLSLNGDDAVELFYDSTGLFQGAELRIACFGKVNLAGSNWNYQDGWAYRRSGSSDTAFHLKDWYFSQSGQFSASQNNLCANPYPLGTYSVNAAQADFYFQDHQWYPYPPEGDLSNYSVFIVNGLARLSAKLKIDKLKIAPRASLSIDSLIGLKICSHLENWGELLLKHDAALLLDSGSSLAGSGKYHLEKWIIVPDARRFSFWASPLVDQKIGTVFGSLSGRANHPLDRYYWDIASQNWQSVYDSTKMQLGFGYIFTPAPPKLNLNQIKERREFRGTISTQSISLNYSHAAGDYLLLGNPYPSPISAQAFIEANPHLDGSIYRWDNSLTSRQQAYSIWNRSGGLAAQSGARLPDSLIASAQGFFVRALSAGDSVLFWPSMQRLAPTSFFKTNRSIPSGINLQLAHDSIKVESLIRFDAQFTKLFDPGYDAQFFEATAQIALASFSNGALHSINYRPLSQDTIRLMLNCDSGLHNLSAQLEDLPSSSVWLWDSLLNLDWSFDDGRYHFQTDSAGRYDKRFYLVLRPEKLSSPESDTCSVTFFSREGALHCVSEKDLQSIEVRDLSAKVLHRSVERPPQFPIPLPVDNPQFLVLRYQIEEKIGSQLILFNPKP